MPFRGYRRVARLPNREHRRWTAPQASPVDDALILNESWPDDLDPADVPFVTRSSTVPRRMGYFGDPSRFNALLLRLWAGGSWRPSAGACGPHLVLWGLSVRVAGEREQR